MSTHIKPPSLARRNRHAGRRFWASGLVAALVFGGLVQGTVTARAQGEVRSSHGDWQMRCDTPPGASSEQCALIQNVTASDRENVGLSVIVLKTADKQARILRVLAPLGVLLPSGLGLRVDNADIGRAGFVRCLPNGLGLNVDGKDIGRAYFVRCFSDGCYAEVILEEALLETLRTGSMATFIVFQTPEEGIGIPVDLVGFTEGFNALP
ncbi:MAG: invasion associated locus B family protein [Pseudomonadota bacterium]